MSEVPLNSKPFFQEGAEDMAGAVAHIRQSGPEFGIYKTVMTIIWHI